MSGGHILWAAQVEDNWEAIRTELDRAFQMSRSASQAEQSFVYVVQNDDLLGRGTTGGAIVAAGLLSAARTAAIEGSRKGWTANVIAAESDSDREAVESLADYVMGSGVITGDLIHMGSDHVGKALP